MKITPCAPATLRSGCRSRSSATRTRRAAPTAWRRRSGSASTPGRSLCARSAAICAWTTRPWGRTTHLAARMEQLALPGTVRLTGETVRLAEGYIDVRSLGPIPVKGLSEPIEIFELTGAGQARTRLQAAALQGLTRFVGRDAEVEHLRGVLGRAAAGRGQVVAIVGEAGVGKSRLVHEFTHSHRVQDWLILEASSVPYGKSTSYLPVIDLLKGYFKIGDRDDHREMRDKVLGRVLGLDRALEPVLAPLLALLDPCRRRTWRPR